MPEIVNLFDAAGAAQYLKISKALLAKLRREGEVEYVKMGGTIRYRLKDLDKFTDHCLRTGPAKKPPARSAST